MKQRPPLRTAVMDSSAPIDHPPGDSRSIEQCAAEWLARREFNACTNEDEAALQAWLGTSAALASKSRSAPLKCPANTRS